MCYSYLFNFYETNTKEVHEKVVFVLRLFLLEDKNQPEYLLPTSSEVIIFERKKLTEIICFLTENRVQISKVMSKIWQYWVLTYKYEMGRNPFIVSISKHSMYNRVLALWRLLWNYIHINYIFGSRFHMCHYHVRWILRYYLYFFTSSRVYFDLLNK